MPKNEKIPSYFITGIQTRPDLLWSFLKTSIKVTILKHKENCTFLPFKTISLSGKTPVLKMDSQVLVCLISLISPPTSLGLTYLHFCNWVSLLSLRHAKSTSDSGSLHMRFILTRPCFPQSSTYPIPHFF